MYIHTGLNPVLLLLVNLREVLYQISFCEQPEVQQQEETQVGGQEETHVRQQEETEVGQQEETEPWLF